MSKLSSNPRKRQGVPSIDLDELYNAPNNRGMCSFLERPPEEARLRRELRLAVDEADAAQARSTVPFPVNEPQPVIQKPELVTDPSILQAAGDIHLDGFIPPTHLIPPGNMPAHGEVSVNEPQTVPIRHGELVTAPGTLTAAGDIHGDSLLHVDEELSPQAELNDNLHKTELLQVLHHAAPPADSKLPGDGFIPGALVVPAHSFIPVPGSITVPDAGHIDEHDLVANTLNPILTPERISDSTGATPQPDRTFLRAVRTKLPRVYIQPEARTPGKVPAPGVLLGELISPGGRITKIKRCVLAQDGHSNGEQVLYAALWNEANPERDDSKTITVGMGALSRLARMDISNVRKNIRSLVEKLSVEIIADEISDVQQGKTYRIFSYRRILENRRQAGLEWVVKSKGVTFIDPTQYGIAIPTGDIRAGRTLPGHLTLPAPSPGDIQAVATGNPPSAASSKPPVVPAGISQGPYSKEFSNDKKLKQKLSSEIPPDLSAKLRQVLPALDDDAVRSLVTRCRQHDPECTSEEIEYCFRVKANQLLRRGKQVTNTVGLMLWAVPKCFEGSQPLHLAFREQQRAERDRQSKADQEWKQQLAEYRRLAEDPSTSEEDRRWYNTMLNP